MAASVLFAPAIQAAQTYSYNLSPDDIGTGTSSLLIVNPTPGGDSLPVAGAYGPVGWGDTSIVTNIDGVNAKYTQLYINIQLAFMTPVTLTISDIVGITYWTKEGVANSGDWALRLYSEPVPGQSSGWYGHRFEGSSPAPGNTNWNMWDANSAGWFKTVASGSGGASDTTGYSLTGLHANYGSEKILYFSIFAGSSTNMGPISNYLDGVVISLANGDQVRLNLVPEPGIIALASLGSSLLLGHLLMRRKKC